MTAPVWTHVGVVCMLDDALLMVRHGHGAAAGVWDLPSGPAEHGEALAEAVVRICGSLAGVEVLCGPFMSWVEHPDADSHRVVLYFEAVPLGGPEEVPAGPGTGGEGGGPVEVRAVPLAEVPGLRLAPGVDQLLAEQGVIDTVV